MSQLTARPVTPVPADAQPPAGTDTGMDTDLRNASLDGRPREARSATGTSPGSLASIARTLVSRTGWWQPLLRFDPESRWYTRLTTGDGWEAWLLTWLPGQGTDLHDHGGSAGAFAVLSGALLELTPAPVAAEPARTASRLLIEGEVRAFGASHVHRVTNTGDVPATSLHVYGPVLTVMNRYELDPLLGPVIALTERAGADW